MSYITPAQLINRPGLREIAQIATPEEYAIVDTALLEATLTGASRSAWTADEISVADDALSTITTAIGDATSLIDGYLAMRGYLPLHTVPTIVTAWARSIVRYMLHKDRIGEGKDDPIVRDYSDAIKLLQQVADGKFSLGVNGSTQSTPALDVMILSDKKLFGRRRR